MRLFFGRLPGINKVAPVSYPPGWFEGGPGGGLKEIYGDYLAFQTDQLLWLRFAESRFNQYMQGVTL